MKDVDAFEEIFSSIKKWGRAFDRMGRLRTQALQRMDQFYGRSAENIRDNLVKALEFAPLSANGSFR
jgi:hypothetical protein